MGTSQSHEGDTSVERALQVLHNQYLTACSSKDAKTCRALCEKLERLIAEDKNMNIYGSRAPDLLRFLCDNILSDESVIKSQCLSLLYDLCSYKSNQAYLISNETWVMKWVISAIDSLVDKSYGENSAYALLLLDILTAFAVFTKEKLHVDFFSNALTLAPLSKILRKCSKDDNIYLKILSIFEILSEEEVVKDYVAKPEFELLDYFVTVLPKSPIGTKHKILIILKNLAKGSSRNKVIMGSSELGLLPLLCNILVLYSNDFSKVDLPDPTAPPAYDEFCAIQIMSILMSVSASSGNKRLLTARKETSILPLLHSICMRRLNLISKQNESINDRMSSSSSSPNPVISKDEIISYTIGTLWNISAAIENIPLIASEEFIFISMLIRVVDSDRGETRSWALGTLANLSNCHTLDNDTVPTLLMKQGLHVAVLKILRDAGPDRDVWTQRAEWKYVAKANTILMNLSACDCAGKALRAEGAVDVALPIYRLSSNGCESLKALLTLSFLLGRQEASRRMKSVAGNGTKGNIAQNERGSLPVTRGKESDDALEAEPSVFVVDEAAVSSLLAIYRSVLDQEDGDGYTFGTFDHSVILKAFLCLSISDQNKRILVAGPLLQYLCRSVRLFVEGKPALQSKYRSAGGGAEDVHSVDLAVETMLHLSFFFEDSGSLLAEYMVPSTGVKEMMTALTNHPKTTLEIRQNAQLLLSRLQPTASIGRSPSAGKPLSDTLGTSVERRSHVMLSYCWAKEARPELVKRLGEALSLAGYNVWRDETGSSLVAPMSGGTDERMAEAVEASSVIVVCVSRPYKERPNCRMEAKYANQLLKKGRLRILFVMMQMDYTTVSEPDCCDGWLGIMIGDALWYPLWDESAVQTTASSIAAILGEQAKVVAAPPYDKVSKKIGESNNIAAHSKTIEEHPFTGEKAEFVAAGSGAAAVTSLRSAERGIGEQGSGVNPRNMPSSHSDLLNSGLVGGNENLVLQLLQENARLHRLLREREVECALLKREYEISQANQADQLSTIVGMRCWILLHTPENLTGRLEDLRVYREAIGLHEPSGLIACEEKNIVDLGAMMKPVPRFQFEGLIRSGSVNP